MIPATDAISVLAALLRHDGREIDASSFGPQEELVQFINAGWLKPAGIPHAVLCRACDEAHWADVIAHNGHLEALCTRTGETFAVDGARLHRVDGAAFCQSLAEALDLEGNARLVGGYTSLWTLGARVLGDTRIAFFFTTSLEGLDVATTMLEAVTTQARSLRAALIVDDDIDAVRLMPKRHAVVALRSIAAVSKAGQITVDEDRLITEIVPDSAKPRTPGRPREKRDLIMNLLDEHNENGIRIESSNEFVRRIQEDFGYRFPGHSAPRSTVREAIKIWLDRNTN